jgi:hypothetical protein
LQKRCQKQLAKRQQAHTQLARFVELRMRQFPNRREIPVGHAPGLGCGYRQQTCHIGPFLSNVNLSIAIQYMILANDIVTCKVREGFRFLPEERIPQLSGKL